MTGRKRERRTRGRKRRRGGNLQNQNRNPGGKTDIGKRRSRQVTLTTTLMIPLQMTSRRLLTQAKLILTQRQAGSLKNLEKCRKNLMN